MKRTVAFLSHRSVSYLAAAALLGAYFAVSTAHATKSMKRIAPASSAGKVARMQTAAPAVTPAALIGANVHVNDPNADPPSSPFHTQSETAIAVNPISGTVCVGFNDFLGVNGGVKFASSNDDGASFQDRGALPPQVLGGASALAAADPTMFWRRFDGKFYFLSVVGFADALGLWVSNDDCKTFTAVANIVVPPMAADKPMIAVDNDPSSAHYGRAYLAWKGDNQRTAFRYSDDMATWSATTFLSVSGPWAFAAWPVVAPGGKLYVFWSQLNGPTVDVKYVSSTNGGSSFSAIIPAVSGAITPYNAAATSDPLDAFLNGGIKAEPFSQVAVGSDGCLHLVYPVGPNTSHTGDCSDIYYRRSCDGTTWSTALKINDDATATDQWSPTVSVGPGGLVSIAYYDRRSSASNTNYEYYNRVSINNGTSFQTSTRISSAVSPLFVELGGYHGDYDMQAQRPGALYLVWSDDRDITAGQHSSDVWFQKACLQAGCTIAPAQPRQLAPISGSKVTSRRPNFKVKLGNGSNALRVDVCRDRACTNIVTTLRATGSTVAPTADLPTGVLFWRAFGRNGTTDGLASSATWQFRVTPVNSAIKTSWGAEPDYNGDGRADAAFSARDAGGKGKAYVYNSDGSAAGIPATASRVLTSPSSTDTLFGQAIVSAGDLNGDGFADLVVSAVHGNSGVLYVYYGSPSGIASRPGAMLSPPSPAYAFGRPQAAGDINGDGYGDLLVTDPGYQGTNTYGRAYTYYGGPAGLPASPSQILDPPLPSAYVYYGYYDGSVGDVNGDGFGDVVVASFAPVTTSSTFLYLGSATGLKPPTQVSATSGLVVASQGIAFGDVNADGLSDITIGVQPTGGGMPVVALYPGSSTAPGGFVNSTPLVYGNAPGTMHVADMNNDGFEDLIMAITASSTSPGVIYVYSGGAFGYLGLPSSTTNGPDGNNSGWANAFSVLGDVDGDGHIDVGVGAVNAASNAGKFYVYRGAAAGWLSATAARTLTGTDGAGSLFGALIAGIE